ncbi:MAG: AMP-binding protein [Alphaproteobacteria bacterium]|nr:AMP-binding protein [Alphaproteobacteria bacterium]
MPETTPPVPEETKTEPKTEVKAEAAAEPKKETKRETPALPRRSWIGRQFNKGMRATLRLGFRVFYGNEITGQENFKGTEGKPLLIVANHTSFLDGLLLAAALPVEPAFAIDTGQYEAFTKNPITRFFMNRVDFYPMDTTRPQAIRELSRLAQAGKPVMIFPEGRLTTTGTLMQIFDGAATVADTAKAKIISVYMNGLNHLPFGTTRLKNYPKKLFPKLSTTIMPPVELDLPDDVTGKARRKMRHDQLEKIMHDLPVNALDPKRSLIDALHDAADNFGRKYDILDDAEGAPLNYGTVLTGAYTLGGKLAKETTKGENVGFLLPNSKGAAVAFWGLQAYGRVPTMLNAKAESKDMMSYTETASLKTVVTSRRFVKMAKLEDKIEELSKKCKIVYLEDVKKKIGFFSKIKAVMQSRGWLPRPKDKPEGKDPAAIIFTSGSEGPPKGVVLSGSNLLANVAQVHAVTPYTPNDRIFNAMPIFHSFGLTGGMVMPMVKGLRSFQYPTPLDGKIIPKLVYFYDTTIMFGTDTFLNLYARNASDKDLAPLRMVFAGAERLSDETYDTYVERFGVRPNQAYGLSEAAPGVAMNVPGAHKRGTVGKFLPGIETKLEPVPDMENSYRLSIKGPNIMLGYLKNDNPGVIQAPPDGWHDTGDIVNVSEDGYVKLTGRAKRFAKIGGEMVSLDAVENVANAASLKKDVANATVLKQDAEKGDSIALFTTDPDLKREQLAKAAQETGRSVLGLPKNPDIHVLKDMPKLPTGKTDYVSLKKMLAGDFNEAAATQAPATQTPAPQPAEAKKPDPKKQAPGA